MSENKHATQNRCCGEKLAAIVRLSSFARVLIWGNFKMEGGIERTVE